MGQVLDRLLLIDSRPRIFLRRIIDVDEVPSEQEAPFSQHRVVKGILLTLRRGVS